MGNIMKKEHLIIVLASLIFTGCTNLGPKTVARDRFDYNTAISNSWKEQTLLNIVKIRYADMPLFVEVASIVSGYTFEGSVDLSGTVSSKSAVQGDFFSMGTTGTYTDRPTITYTPITGQQFNKSFMTPIPPRAILFLMQSGWSVDLIFPITVDSINGLRSGIAGGLNKRSGDVGYHRVIDLLRKTQKSGGVGMQIQSKNDKEDATLMLIHRDVLTPDIKEALKELSKLLGLQPGLREIEISYGFLPRSKSEIAMITYSMLQIMIKLATQVDVPPEDVAEGRTVPSFVTSKSGEEQPDQIIKISNSRQKPENAFTAVKYRDRWFWIDDRDFKSKRTFAFLMILFSLTETGGKEGLPLVTIPAS